MWLSANYYNNPPFMNCSDLILTQQLRGLINELLQRDSHFELHKWILDFSDFLRVFIPLPNKAKGL